MENFLLMKNEKRCDEEIEEIRRGFVGSGNANLNTSLIRFSDEALDEQKHCIRIADEKIALAGQAYEMPASIDLEIPVDPNEPTYCVCNQVSYGQMVACDNPSVSTAGREW
ncbi:unnamed protein product [Spirodela intermedia]|uniref:Inhibitor of growth protein N-terminal histone-binding domain-containing protein n=1 Tax=Spirodela intermedia TaxID=51605 RepID=A0A7I8JAG2_SPIIN|nr:unnamed protein product [Spirodela intermedia]CAA6667099.1 unnamed protein product [Spirodela intermedia]